MKQKSPLELLQAEVPANVISETIDDVMIDYSITSILEKQTAPPEKSVEHIKLLRRLRDAFLNQKHK